MTPRSANTTGTLLAGVLAGTTLLAGCGDAAPRAAAPRNTSPPTAPELVVTSDRDGDTELFLRRPDGRLEQLTRNTAADYGAVWSPDGARLAFVSDRDGNDELFVMSVADRVARQVTRTSNRPDGAPVGNRAPAWSPDGTELVFASTRDGGEPELYRVRADGTGTTRLTRTAETVVDHEPSWSPDGRFVVFTSNRYGDGNVEVLRMRPDGSGVVRLTRTPDGVDDNAPRYSPDGSRILFSSNAAGQHDLMTMAADGSGATRLYGDPLLDDVFPRWTSDGAAVVFQTFGRPDRPSGEDVWWVRADGTGATRLLGTAANETMPDPRPAE